MKDLWVFALWKSIGKNCLSMVKLQIFFTEAKTILNSRPLTYVGEDSPNETTLTRFYFLFWNHLTGTQLIQTDNPEHIIKKTTNKDAVLQIWKRQNTLESLWRSRKNNYLLNLRETSRIKLKSQIIQSLETQGVADVIEVNENLPRGFWKDGIMIVFINNSDSEARGTII